MEYYILTYQNDNYQYDTLMFLEKQYIKIFLKNHPDVIDYQISKGEM